MSLPVFVDLSEDVHVISYDGYTLGMGLIFAKLTVGTNLACWHSKRSSVVERLGD
jgi:hypothetical protein